MNVVVCCKLVPSLQEAETRADGSISFDRASWEISEFDLQAIQAGVEAARALSAKLYILTAGDEHVTLSSLRKKLLSRGADEMAAVYAPELAGADTGLTSRVLAAAIKKLDAELVICGEGSADLYYQQTGIQIGERLGWATVNAVDAICVDGGRLTLERNLEKSVQTVSVELPAVLSVTAGINTPTIPNMKAVLSAGKKPFTAWTPADVGADTEATVEVLGTVASQGAERKNIVFEGSAEEAAEKLLRSLKSEGAL